MKFFSVLICFLSLFQLGQIQASEELLGDVSDGSRATPVHRIFLYDETGARIYPEDSPTLPFSTKQTCLQCHDYQKISGGWHFNTAGEPGRRGQPWILTDPITATQIPLSHRNWPGTFRPESVGRTPFYFLQDFGRQLPGGGVGENDSSDTADLFMRWLVSGKLEINCLSCHDAEAAHDQTEFARNTRNQSFRWAATASSGFATVQGSAANMPDNYDIYRGVAPDDARSVPPSVEYDLSRFDPQKKVFFDLTRNIPNERCYFCHSTKSYLLQQGEARWHSNEDVHIAAGLNCVDCHRNGLDHAMIRGYESEAESGIRASFSCKGCHLGDDSAELPQEGHFGAPRPAHIGLPTIHFEKLTCTACHAGRRPTGKTQLVKTALAHGLGTHGIHKTDEVVPFIHSPVMANDEDGKIAPHNLLWPAFWGFLSGDSLQPLAPETVSSIVLAVIAKDTLTDSTNYARILSGTWPAFSDSQFVQILDSLAVPDSGKTPVYVGAGKLHLLSATGQLEKKAHSAAEPYYWPIAHDVRPAAQSLGSGGCDDCHSVNSAFNFGKIGIRSPLTTVSQTEKSMSGFQEGWGIYHRLFAFTFFFRPLLKLIILFAGLILAAVLVLYFFKGLDRILKYNKA